MIYLIARLELLAWWRHLSSSPRCRLGSPLGLYFCPSQCPTALRQRAYKRTRVIHQRAAATSKGERLIGGMSPAWDHTVSDCHSLLNPKGEVGQCCFLESAQRGKSNITNIQPIQVFGNTTKTVSGRSWYRLVARKRIHVSCTSVTWLQCKRN